MSRFMHTPRLAGHPLSIAVSAAAAVVGIAGVAPAAIAAAIPAHRVVHTAAAEAAAHGLTHAAAPVTAVRMAGMVAAVGAAVPIDVLHAGAPVAAAHGLVHAAPSPARPRIVQPAGELAAAVAARRAAPGREPFSMNGRPRAPLRQDPADSLYSAARASLNRAEYQAAADLFRQVRTRFPGSAYAPDALHWEAFALYRLGGTDDLRAALIALELQRERYPERDTATDSDALAARIRGELAQRGDAPAAEQLAEQAAQTAGSCPDEDDDLRISALNALIQMDSDRALPILEQVLARRDACSAPLREKAVFLVSQKASSEATDILLTAARNDPSLQVRRRAVFWLSQVDDERAVDALEEILRGSSDPEVRERAVFALSQHGSPRASEILRSYAQQTEAPAELREEAIFWLGQNASAGNAEFLRGLYGRLTNVQLKERVLFSVSQMGGQQNGRWLLDVALDEAEPVEARKNALFWAGQSGVPVDQLTGLYDSMAGRELKEQLIFVYSQRDEPEAIDALIEIARTDPVLELRKKALFWLGQSDDPRATEVLMEIINRE